MRSRGPARLSYSCRRPADMRWMIAVGPSSKRSRNSLPRRPIDAIARPSRAETGGSNVRSALSPGTSTEDTTTPRSASSSRRAVISTSGSSGIRRCPPPGPRCVISRILTAIASRTSWPISSGSSDTATPNPTVPGPTPSDASPPVASVRRRWRGRAVRAGHPHGPRGHEPQGPGVRHRADRGGGRCRHRAHRRRRAGRALDRAEALRLADLGGPDENVLIVGHNPDFAQVVHDLTGARVRVKKGSLVGVQLGGGAPELIAVLRPADLSPIAGIALVE